MTTASARLDNAAKFVHKTGGFRGVLSLLCGYLEVVKEKLGPQRISKHTTPKLPRKE